MNLCKKYHLVYCREINLWPDIRGVFRTLSSICDRCSTGFQISLRVLFSVCVPNVSCTTDGNTIYNAAERCLILSLQECLIFKGIEITKWKAIKKMSFHWQLKWFYQHASLKFLNKNFNCEKNNLNLILNLLLTTMSRMFVVKLIMNFTHLPVLHHS